MEHLRLKHSKVYQFSCDECGREFARKYQLAQHQQVYSTERPFQCEECGRRYQRKSSLFTHRRRSKHSIGDAKRIDNYQELENSLDHKLAVLFSMFTGNDDEVNIKPSISRASNGLDQCPQFRCGECGKEFTRRCGLAKHQRLEHVSANAIECGHCGKLFKQRHSFQRHCQLHSIKNPFQSRS